MFKRGENVKATLKVQGQLHNLKAGIYIVGKTSTEVDHDIVINDASVDVKHAAIEILSAKWRVIDMCSKLGTFVQNERLTPLHAKDIANQTTIKFGAISCDFSAKEDDDEDLFGDSPCSDIIPGSPEQSIKSQTVHSGTSRIRNRSRKSITLTPQKNEKQIEKSSALQKEVAKVKSPEPKETKQKDESFLIPSTQSRLNKSNLNSTKEFRTSVCAFEEDEDDFFIPETQELAHSESRSSKSDETIRFVTEDFNGGEDELCLQSQNVLGEAASFLEDASEIIPYIRPDGNLSTSKPMSEANAAEDDKEMSALQWNETNISNLKPTDDLKSTSVTPDLDFDDDAPASVKDDDPVKIVSETEDLPATQLFIPQPQKPPKDLSKASENVYNISPTNKENALSIPNVNAKLNVDGSFAVPFPVRKSDSKRESSFKEPEKKKIESPVLNKVFNKSRATENEDDDLVATQIFDASHLKSSKEPPKAENEDDDLLPTQVFNASLYLSKKVVNADVNSEDLLDKTQPFIMSPKNIQNKNKDDGDIFVRPPTQEFLPRKHIRARTPVLLESDEEELSDPELHMAATLPIGEDSSKESNEKSSSKLPRNKLFSSDDEDDSNDKIKMGPPKASTSSSSTKTASSPNALEKRRSKMNTLFGSDDEDLNEKAKEDKSSSSTKSANSARIGYKKSKKNAESTPPKKGTASTSAGSDPTKPTKSRRKSTILMDIPDTPDFINLKLPSKDKLKMAGELFSREAVTTKLTFPFEQSSDEEESCDKTIPFEADKDDVKEEKSIKSETHKSKNTKEKSKKAENVKKEKESESGATTSTEIFKAKSEIRSKSTKKQEKAEKGNDSDSSATTSTKTFKREPSVSSKSTKDSSEQEVRKSSRGRSKPKRIDEEVHEEPQKPVREISSPPPPSRTSKRRLHNIPDEDVLLKNIKSLQKEDKRKRESSAANSKSNKKRTESKPSEPEVPEKRTRLRKRNASTEKASASSSGKQSSCESESSPARKATRPVKQRVVFTKVESSPFERKLRRMETRSRPLRN